MVAPIKNPLVVWDTKLGFRANPKPLLSRSSQKSGALQRLEGLGFRV